MDRIACTVVMDVERWRDRYSEEVGMLRDAGTVLIDGDRWRDRCKDEVLVCKDRTVCLRC